MAHGRVPEAVRGRKEMFSNEATPRSLCYPLWLLDIPTPTHLAPDEPVYAVAADLPPPRWCFINAQCVCVSHVQDLSTLQCDVCILVFSVTDRRSFHRTAQLRLLLREAQPQTPIILAGNKSDLVRSREISSEGTWGGGRRTVSVQMCNCSRLNWVSREEPVHWLPHCSCPCCLVLVVHWSPLVPLGLVWCIVSYHCKEALSCFLSSKDL